MESNNISQKDGVALIQLSDLLHQFYHRNKNQHRRSVWWRHFQIFRKQLQKVSIEVRTLHAIPSTHIARMKKKADDLLITQRIAQMISFWQDIMVRRWQHAFSQLSADGRFAVLGLVLLAALAEACRIMKITAAFEDMGQAEVEKVLLQFANEDWEQDHSEGVGRARGEDIGESINRELVEEVHHAGSDTRKTNVQSTLLLPQSASMASSPSIKRAAIGAERSARKKRRTGNTIDDLFGGLG